MTSKFLDAALQYIDMGFSVVILGKEAKEPITAHTPNGLKDATRDREKATEWWSSTPKCNVGAVLGAASGGIAVIDIDCKHGVDGYETMRNWELEHGDMPETVMCCTPTGGYHLYYRVDREVRPSTNDVLGVDIRGDDSYVVMPPSIHPDVKKEYVWDTAPDEFEIAEANDLVYEFIEYVRPKDDETSEAKQSEQSDKGDDGEIKEGGRNAYLFRQGRSVRGKGFDNAAVEAFLRVLNNTSCKPPLGDAELRKIIRSVCSKPPGMSDEAKASSRASSGEKPGQAKHVVISRKLLDSYSACFLDGAPAVFDGLSYQIGWNAVEKAILREWPTSKDRDRKEVIKYLSLVMPRKEQSPAKYIGFKNGVLDIETMELLPFSSDMLIPNVIPHNWNPNAQSYVLNRTLQKIACNDPFIESNLCEFMGLCMYRSGKYAFAGILLGRQGETASNGKSTYIDMIRAILGKDNYSSLSLHMLGARFNQDYLAGKLANLGDDISSEFARGDSLEVFKKAVSGSEITTDVKGTKGYQFKPYCTMLFSANEFPKMENLDDGILRRLFPIRFNAHFTSEDPDFDPDIGEKLAQEDAVETAIVRGVCGLRRVIKNRRPTDNAESRRMVNDIKIDNSTIYQWIEDESIVKANLASVTVGFAYDNYDEWCKNSGVRNKYAKWQFSKKICSHFGFKVLSTTRSSKKVRIFIDA